VIFCVYAINPDGFEYFDGLKKLEKFYFSFMDDRFHSPSIKEASFTTAWIYSLCAQRLPRLRLIVGSLKPYIKPMKFTPKFDGTSHLEALKSQFLLPEASLPNLKYLNFCGEIRDWHFFRKISSYRNLSRLKLKSTHDCDLDKILELIGTQLSELEIKDYQTDLAKIFHLCPNLVIFWSMITTKVQSEETNFKFTELISSHNFRRLEHFYISPLKMPAGFLKLILNAPPIESVSVNPLYLKMEDCVWLRDVVEGRFQRLKWLEFSNVVLEPGCTMDHLGLMVKFLVCGAPNLKKVEMHFIEDRRPTLFYKWLNEQPGANKFMELVAYKDEFRWELEDDDDDQEELEAIFNEQYQ